MRENNQVTDTQLLRCLAWGICPASAWLTLTAAASVIYSLVVSSLFICHTEMPGEYLHSKLCVSIVFRQSLWALVTASGGAGWGCSGPAGKLRHTAERRGTQGQQTGSKQADLRSPTLEHGQAAQKAREVPEVGCNYRSGDIHAWCKASVIFRLHILQQKKDTCLRFFPV